mmetsp:Transcript_16697/g.33234  ORF Transcript_16697/g.33234 Transcript_16697/m.33234 type:complete len:916 (+) Transcript_16697:220-2967(+)|eukprot:CAMPEP_0194306908 /NCGR_PEP_ID=MMETSP0171-20130528/3864_1 /TAXON_ID=218684 /ORGANISM="Corethron pennatum, Strain L29A3" /LENGTH=915 /DNA_ID=CAMNT_0039058765 /DNA_START=94 /DNA_END=2841 /DNA_ORIENTATION=-
MSSSYPSGSSENAVGGHAKQRPYNSSGGVSGDGPSSRLSGGSKIQSNSGSGGSSSHVPSSPYRKSSGHAISSDHGRPSSGHSTSRPRSSSIEAASGRSHNTESHRHRPSSSSSNHKRLKVSHVDAPKLHRQDSVGSQEKDDSRREYRGDGRRSTRNNNGGSERRSKGDRGSDGSRHEKTVYHPPPSTSDGRRARHHGSDARSSRDDRVPPSAAPSHRVPRRPLSVPLLLRGMSGSRHTGLADLAPLARDAAAADLREMGAFDDACVRYSQQLYRHNNRERERAAAAAVAAAAAAVAAAAAAAAAATETDAGSTEKGGASPKGAASPKGTASPKPPSPKPLSSKPLSPCAALAVVSMSAHRAAYAGRAGLGPGRRGGSRLPDGIEEDGQPPLSLLIENAIDLRRRIYLSEVSREGLEVTYNSLRNHYIKETRRLDHVNIVSEEDERAEPPQPPQAVAGKGQSAPNKKKEDATKAAVDAIKTDAEPKRPKQPSVPAPTLSGQRRSELEFLQRLARAAGDAVAVRKVRMEVGLEVLAALRYRRLAASEAERLAASEGAAEKDVAGGRTVAGGVSDGEIEEGEVLSAKVGSMENDAGVSTNAAAENTGEAAPTKQDEPGRPSAHIGEDDNRSAPDGGGKASAQAHVVQPVDRTAGVEEDDVCKVWSWIEETLQEKESLCQNVPFGTTKASPANNTASPVSEGTSASASGTFAKKKKIKRTSSGGTAGHAGSSLSSSSAGQNLPSAEDGPDKVPQGRVGEKAEIIPWDSLALPITPHNVPLLVSTLSSLPDRVAAAGYGSVLGGSQHDLTWLEAGMPNCQSIRKDEAENLMHLKLEAARLAEEVHAEKESSEEIHRSLVEMRDLTDGVCAKISMIRSEMAAIANRHRLVVNAAELSSPSESEGEEMLEDETETESLHGQH